MKRIGLEKIYEVGLLSILLLIVVHAPIVVWLGSIFSDYQTPIKAWKEIILTLLAALAVILLTRRKLWRPVLSSPIIVLSLAFIDIHLLCALILGGDKNSVVAGLMIDLRFIVMFMLMYVLVILRPAALGRVVKVLVVGAVVVVGFGILQITVLPDNILSSIGYSNTTIAPFTTIDRNPDFVRINSTLRGPNPLGALMVIYIAMALAYLAVRSKKVNRTRTWQAIGLIVGSIAVLFASYSRSAYVAIVAVVVSVAFTLGKFSKKTTIVGISSVAVVGFLGFLLSQTSWFSNVILHEDPKSSVQTKSNDGHVSSIEDGLKRVAKQPFGSGIGSTGSASLQDNNKANDVTIENYYLFVAHESGWLGLLNFVALFSLIIVLAWRKRLQSWLVVTVFSSGIGLAFIALLLPVWADDTVAIIWWGLAGSVMASVSGIIKSGNAKRTRQQKTTRTA